MRESHSGGACQEERSSGGSRHGTHNADENTTFRAAPFGTATLSMAGKPAKKRSGTYPGGLPLLFTRPNSSCITIAFLPRPRVLWLGAKRPSIEVLKAKLTQKPALMGSPWRSCPKKPQNQPFSSSLHFTSAPLLLMIVMTEGTEKNISGQLCLNQSPRWKRKVGNAHVLS